MMSVKGCCKLNSSCFHTQNAMRRSLLSIYVSTSTMLFITEIYSTKFGLRICLYTHILFYFARFHVHHGFRPNLPFILCSYISETSTFFYHLHLDYPAFIPSYSSQRIRSSNFLSETYKSRQAPPNPQQCR